MLPKWVNGGIDRSIDKNVMHIYKYIMYIFKYIYEAPGGKKEQGIVEVDGNHLTIFTT